MLSTMRDKNRQRLEKAGAVLFALIVWQIASLMLGQELLLVSPIKVVQRLLSLCAVPDFWDSIGFSFVRIMEGFFTALLAGTVLAVAAGRFHLVDVLLWPVYGSHKSPPRGFLYHFMPGLAEFSQLVCIYCISDGAADHLYQHAGGHHQYG